VSCNDYNYRSRTHKALIMAAGTEAWDLQATVRDGWDLCNRGGRGEKY